MASAKQINVHVIDSKSANAFVKRHHYSGKVVANSHLHFGAFLYGKLHGVMSFGPSMDKSKIIGLVDGTKWNEFIELNRMAFDEHLPKNSESRCISIAMKMLRKNAPHIKWVISFADGTQCGDGTIYRASGFVLTGITKNKTIMEFPNGERVAALTLETNSSPDIIKRVSDSVGVKPSIRTRSEWVKLGAKYVDGYMLRYIYFLDKASKEKLTTEIIPFSKIGEIGAGMYKGEKVER